jgi:Ca2+-transporting ATPase
MRSVPSPLASTNGLAEAEARARLEAEGYNELPTSERRSSLRIILEVMREPMMALLLAGGLIYLAIGDAEGAVVLLAFATLSVVITIVQESRTERRDLTSPRALVIRDGTRNRIARREVARGDLVCTRCSWP